MDPAKWLDPAPRSSNWHAAVMNEPTCIECINCSLLRGATAAAACCLAAAAAAAAQQLHLRADCCYWLLLLLLLLAAVANFDWKIPREFLYENPHLNFFEKILQGK
jgi:hypothetical protein